MRAGAAFARPGGRALLATLLLAGLGGCGDTTASTSTTPVVDTTRVGLDAAAPDGTEVVGSLSWDEGRVVLDQGVAGLSGRLDELGLIDASVTVLATEGAGEPLDLDEGDQLLVGAALAFGDEDGAVAAREALLAAATEYAASSGVMAEGFDAAGLAPGAVGLAVPAGTFPGGAAAVAWVDGDVLRLAFAQGGSAREDLPALAAFVMEQRP